MFKKFIDYINESSFSGQSLIQKEKKEFDEFCHPLAKQFPNWSFRVINTQREHPRIKGQTLTYSSSSTDKEEITKVKELIQKFSGK